MGKIAVMKLRIAIATDFANKDKSKKIGTLYFQQSVTGEIEPQPQYFTNNTDMSQFKLLYSKNQIYVPMQLFDEVEILEEELNEQKLSQN